MHDNFDIKKAWRRFSIKSFSLVMVAKVINFLKKKAVDESVFKIGIRKIYTQTQFYSCAALVLVLQLIGENQSIFFSSEHVASLRRFKSV